jgi:hypothetical protein
MIELKMTNVKVQMSNQIQSSNIKSPQPPFAKGGRGGIIDWILGFDIHLIPL